MQSKWVKILIGVFVCFLAFCAVTVFMKVFTIDDLQINFIAALLGTVITAVVTVLLLSGQSAAEEVKERNVKVFQKKSKIFQKYIKKIWHVWEDQIVTAEEFQDLTADYYSKLMIYLNQKGSIDRISDCLLHIGNCIDKESFEDYKTMRDNIIEIINVLSDEINLGGKINTKKVEELDGKMFPVIFKKTLVSEFKTKLLLAEPDLFFEGLKKGYSKQYEYLFFSFKKHPNCRVVIGPFDTVSQMKIGLDITKQLHQFDKYRQPGKYSYWIKTIRGDNGNELFLNDRLPQEETADEIENDNSLGKIADFGFNDVKSLKQFRGNFRKVAQLLAQRAEYYVITAKTINKEFTIVELPETNLEQKN